MKTARSPWRATSERFEVLVVGCGLIGGSIARSMRRRWRAVRITAVDRPSVLDRARALRIAHRGLPLRRALVTIEREAVDLVVLALPVDSIVDVLPRLAQAARSAARPPLVIDVGSVKAPVVATAERHACPRFVGGHPMAGSEQGGLAASSAKLLVGRPFVLCPSATASSADRNRARRWAAGLGARPVELDAAVHDRVVALTSHVPHVAAWTLMDVAMRHEAALGSGLPWTLAAGSWRDATRVAASDPAVWAPIVRHNREAIGNVLDEWIASLQRVREGLARAEGRVLEDGRAGIDAAAIARQRRRIRAKLPPVDPSGR
jgi:prephenate dehydrogenase